MKKLFLLFLIVLSVCAYCDTDTYNSVSGKYKNLKNNISDKQTYSKQTNPTNKKESIYYDKNTNYRPSEISKDIYNDYDYKTINRKYDRKELSQPDNDKRNGYRPIFRYDENNRYDMHDRYDRYNRRPKYNPYQQKKPLPKISESKYIDQRNRQILEKVRNPKRP